MWLCPGVCRCGLASYIRPGRQAQAGLPLKQTPILQARKWRCQAQPEGVEQAQRPVTGRADWSPPRVGAPPLAAQTWSSQKRQHVLHSARPPGPRSFLPLALCPCSFPFPEATAQHPSASSGSEASLRSVPSACMLRPCRAAWPLGSVPPRHGTVPGWAPSSPTLDPTAFKAWPRPPPPAQAGQGGHQRAPGRRGLVQGTLGHVSPAAPGAPALFLRVKLGACAWELGGVHLSCGFTWEGGAAFTEHSDLPRVILTASVGPSRRWGTGA